MLLFPPKQKAHGSGNVPSCGRRERERDGAGRAKPNVGEAERENCPAALKPQIG